MEGLKAIPYIALVIAISGIVIGAAAIVLSKFGDTVTDCGNSSWTISTVVGRCGCDNNTNIGGVNIGPSNSNMSAEQYAICQAQIGQNDIAEQLPTIAIIGIMVIIISIIAGVFVYMQYFA